MRRIIILALLFLCSVNLRAQADAASLERARDYINARLTYLMLAELKKTDKSVQEKWDKVEGLLRSNTPESILSYKVMSDSMSLSFGRTIKRLSEPISKLDLSKYDTVGKDIAAQRIVTDALRILSQAYPEVYPVVENGRAELLDDVRTILPETVEQPDSIRQQETAPVDNIIVREEEAGFFSLQHLSFWTLLAVLLALLATGLSATALNKYLAQEKKRHNRSGTSQQDDYMHASYVTDKELQWYKEHIETKVNALNTAISNMYVEIRKNDRTDHPNDRQLHTPPVMKETEERQDVFYMSSPSNHYFPLSAKSQQKENTLYRFVLGSNKHEAQFEVINDGAPVTQAAYHASTYFEPACNAQNSPGAVVNRIVTVKPGKASYDGEKWIINYKAEIRYE